MQETELNAKERRQLLSVLRELDESAQGDNRHERRRKVSLTLKIRKLTGSVTKSSRVVTKRLDPIQGMLVNVSAKGVGLMVGTRLNDGDKVLIPLRFREGGGWLVLCQVQNCKRLETGLYRAGARFLDRVEDPNGDAKVPMDWVL